MKCRGCKHLASTPAGPGWICLGMPEEPDPPEDIFKLCFIVGDKPVRDISINVVELLGIRRVINEFCDTLSEMMVLSMAE